MTKILTIILILCSTIAFGQNFTWPTKTFKNYKYISKRDTLTIVDTLTGKTSTKYIQYFSYILSINKYGVLKARVSDGYMLLNHQGKILNGPFNQYTFRELKNGYMLAGPKWGGRDHDYLIFSPKGDTVLIMNEAFAFHQVFSDTTLIPGYNPKTNRKEMGFLTKNGWVTKDFMDKNGTWTKPTTK